jgi:hypothetical protein
VRWADEGADTLFSDLVCSDELDHDGCALESAADVTKEVVREVWAKFVRNVRPIRIKKRASKR